MKIMQIILQPVLFKPDRDIVFTLEKTLSEEFNASPIVTASPIKEISDQLFDIKESNGNQIIFYNGFQISTTNHLLNQQQLKYWLYVILMHILVI